MTASYNTNYLKSKISKTRNLNERTRLCALLARANGHSIKVIASILQISDSSVYGYTNDFKKLKKTKNRSKPGRSCKMTKAQEDQLRSHILQNSYKSINDLIVYLNENFNITYKHSGLRDWLKRNNLKKESRYKKS